jgi:uncharacterized protein YjcR
MTKDEITQKAQEILNQLKDCTVEDIKNITYEVRSLIDKKKLLFE